MDGSINLGSDHSHIATIKNRAYNSSVVLDCSMRGIEGNYLLTSTSYRLVTMVRLKGLYE